MAVVLGQVVVGLATPSLEALADSGGALEPRLSQLLGRYVDDPNGTRQALKALGREGFDPLPVGTILVIGDAHLRGGDNIGAIRAFEAVLERNADRPWSTIAELGIGWAALAEGDHQTARLFLQDGLAAETAAATQGTSAVRQVVPGLPEMAKLGVGLLDAYTGGGVAAGSALEQVAVAQNTDPVLRPVARLGVAYARYWAGNFTEAAFAFDHAALEFPDAATADDARYGAAWSRWRAGERGRALDDLYAQARESRPRSGGRAGDALVDLPPNEVLVGGLKRDRLPMVSVAQRVARALDLDGVRLARAAIRRIERGDGDEIEAEQPVRAALVELSPENAPGNDQRASASSSPSREGRSGETTHTTIVAPAAPAALSSGDDDRDPGSPATRLAVASHGPRGIPGTLWLAAAVLVAAFIGRQLWRSHLG